MVVACWPFSPVTARPEDDAGGYFFVVSLAGSMLHVACRRANKQCLSIRKRKQQRQMYRTLPCLVIVCRAAAILYIQTLFASVNQSIYMYIYIYISFSDQMLTTSSLHTRVFISVATRRTFFFLSSWRGHLVFLAVFCFDLASSGCPSENNLQYQLTCTE